MSCCGQKRAQLYSPLSAPAGRAAYAAPPPPAPPANPPPPPPGPAGGAPAGPLRIPGHHRPLDDRTGHPPPLPLRPPQRAGRRRRPRRLLDRRRAEPAARVSPHSPNPLSPNLPPPDGRERAQEAHLEGISPS